MKNLDNNHKKYYLSILIKLRSEISRAGLEPTTKGFTVLYSTN